MTMWIKVSKDKILFELFKKYIDIAAILSKSYCYVFIFLFLIVDEAAMF